MKYYLKRLGHQELGSVKNGKAQRGRYIYISKDKNVLDIFPPLSKTVTNDSSIIPIIPLYQKIAKKIYCNYIYHNDKYNVSGGTRNEYRIYCNGALEGKQLLFQPDDILIFRAEKTSSLQKDILGSNDAPEAAVEEANVFFLYRCCDKNSELYRMCKKLVDESNIRGNGHAIYQGIITEVENKINQLCVKNFNEMDTVIEDTVTAKAQSGDIDEMASLFNSVSFRDFVMTGYKQKCAITGNVIQYKSFMNLEAAHIWPRSHKGLYLPSNGIALCRDMHWAFDKGMFTIGDDFKVKKHCEDEDFNVSLYSNLLLENYSSDDSFKYIRNSKSYFDEIPNRGHKLFIKKNRPSPWINGYDCVMEQIELLSERLEVDGEHLEKRVADYCDKIPDTVQLIKLGRKWRGCRVVCENPNRSFLRVLYKDWYNHKFDWEETELGRIVLSASEPYCLLITPQLWTYNNGYLLNPPESFISSSSVEQKKQIHDILFEGVDDTETVLAGGIIDYTHKEEIFGFMVSYFSIPGLPSKYAAHCYERNSRLLLQSRPDFSEQEHYNITLHHNGIESFQGSNIMCGFSKISLDEFHWHINITVNGMRLFNEGGQEIGRFEYYYGQRGNMGNRYISNQPLLQRWVVSKDAISKARCIVGCPNNIKINHAFDSVIRKYED